MANKLYNQLNSNKQTINNPQVTQILNLAKSLNISPKELFYKKAQEMGVDPNEWFTQNGIDINLLPN